MSDDSWRGKVGALARDEVDGFLAEGRVARLGCLDANGWPYVVPVWQEWDGERVLGRPARRRSSGAGTCCRGRCPVAMDEDGAQRKVWRSAARRWSRSRTSEGPWVPWPSG